MAKWKMIIYALVPISASAHHHQSKVCSQSTRLVDCRTLNVGIPPYQTERLVNGVGC